MKRGIVLFGHGSRNPEWGRPFDAIRQEIARQRPEIPVELGFLELMEPGLPAAIEKLALAGVRDIAVIPIFISAGNHIREDMPVLISQAKQKFPDLTVRVSPALGEAPEIIAAFADFAVRATTAD